MEMKCYPTDLADVVYLKANCLVCLQRESDVLNCFEQAIGHYNDRPRENMSVVKIYMGDDQGLNDKGCRYCMSEKSKIIFKNFSLNPTRTKMLLLLWESSYVEFNWFK